MNLEDIDLTGGSKDDNINTMAEIQKSGIKLAQEILKKNDYVMIADDVGLGKTYEGLGLAFCKLFECEENNIFNGKILIIAPNSNVADKWIREIKEFQSKCLNKKIQLKIQIEDYIENPLDLIKLNNKDMHTISVIRANKFSYIDNNNNNNIEIFSKKLEEYNSKLPEFDLVIIDESQNLRLKTSKKVEYLNTFFGLYRKSNNNTKMKFKKTVFLTATPNHGKKEDIDGQIEFVRKEKINSNKIKVISNLNEYNSKEDINLYIIRRIRTFDNHNKYFYREFKEEKTTDMTFLERLTMSAIQKKQIDENGFNVKMGYLDGFEGFLKKEINSTENGILDDEYIDGDMNDLNNSNDTKERLNTYHIEKLYEELKNEFQENDNLRGKNNIKLNDILSHPKLRKIQSLLKKNNINELNSFDKSLIFVRRKSSIDEIKKVLMTNFDNDITKLVSEILYGKDRKSLNTNDVINDLEKRYLKSKKEIERKSKEYDELNEDDEEIESNELDNDIQENDQNEDSIWLEQLKRKKETLEQTTLFKAKRDFTNYYRFDEFWEENIFKELGFKEFKVKVENKENILKFYIDKYLIIDVNKNEIIELIKQKNISITKTEKAQSIKRLNLKRITTLCVLKKLAKKIKEFEFVAEEYEAYYFEERMNKLKENIDNIVSLENIKLYFENYKNSIWDLKIIDEAFKFNGNFSFVHSGDFLNREIEKDIIKSNMINSEGIIYLIAISTKTSKNDIKQIIKEIEKDNSNFKKRVMDRIVKFIKNFDVENKILGYKNFNIKSNQKEFKKFQEFKKSRKFYNSPIAGCSSSVKNRDKAQKYFNTSFYPDILVTTDILKEGIDLQLFCSRIIHYGIAWLPGDMEQRIGRIDRYFCNTYREYKNNPNKKIEIIFIYMDDPMDKKQVSKIISNMIKSIDELDNNNFIDNSIESKDDKICNLIEEINDLQNNIKIINEICKKGK